MFVQPHLEFLANFKHPLIPIVRESLELNLVALALEELFFGVLPSALGCEERFDVLLID